MNALGTCEHQGRTTGLTDSLEKTKWYVDNRGGGMRKEAVWVASEQTIPEISGSNFTSVVWLCLFSLGDFYRENDKVS